MRRQKLPVLAWFVILGIASEALAAPSAASPPQLFERGVAAFEAGDLEAALVAYRAAFAAAPSYRHAAGLGQVELSLARHRDAAEHLEFCLRHFPADGPPDVRAKIRAGLAEAQGHVARLSVELHPDEATLTLDDVALDRSKSKLALYLEPGVHRAVVRAEGYVEQSNTITAESGGEASLSVTLEPEAAVPAPVLLAEPRRVVDAPSGSSEPEPDGGLAPRTVALVAGGTATLAGVVVGLVFGVDAVDKQDQMDRVRADLVVASEQAAPSLGGAHVDCGAPLPTQRAGCARLVRLRDERDSATTWSTLGFVAGGVFALGTAVSFIWLGPETPPLTIGSSVDAVGAELWLRGSF